MLPRNRFAQVNFPDLSDHRACVPANTKRNICHRSVSPSRLPLSFIFRKVVVLPECWNGPYDTASFPIYAEPVPDPQSEAAAAAAATTSAAAAGVAAAGATMEAPSSEQGPSTAMLCRAAIENKVWIVGGSVPEAGKDGGTYNTCVVVDPNGRIAAKHRKVHLFDIDVPGGITFKYVGAPLVDCGAGHVELLWSIPVVFVALTHTPQKKSVWCQTPLRCSKDALYRVFRFFPRHHCL